MKKEQNQFRQLISLFFNLIGLLIILWIPYTSILNHLSQEKELNKVITQQELDKAEKEKIENQLVNSNVSSSDNLDPFANGNNFDNNYSDGVGAIFIPSIGVQLPLYIGSDEVNLSKGAAQISGTDLPLAGKGTHSVIAGHRGWYGSDYFLNINRLNSGDLIYLSYLGKQGYYVVTDSEIIRPDETSRLLEKTPDEERLTLLTCHPLFSNQQRLLVHSRALTEEETQKVLGSEPSFKQIKKLPNKINNKSDIVLPKVDKDAEIMGNQTTISTAFYKLHSVSYLLYWLILGAGFVLIIYDVFKIFNLLIKK